MSGIVAGTGDQTLLLTERGYLYRGTIEEPYLLYVPPLVDPYEPRPTTMAMAGTPTDATIVGEAGLIRRLLGNVVVQEKGVLGHDLHGVCHGDAFRVAVGAKGGIEVERNGTWQKVSIKTDKTLRAVVCIAGGAVAVGDGGTVVDLDVSDKALKATVSVLSEGGDLYSVIATTNGALWTGGRHKSGKGAALLSRGPAGGAWKDAWPAGTVTPEIPGLALLVAVDANNLLLIDREGGNRRLGPNGLFDESPERLDVRPRAAVTLADGHTILVGEPGLWLGPFLSVPEVTAPTPKASPSNVKLEWAFAPGPKASATRVHIEAMKFPFWWLYLDPEVTSTKLPDFKKLKNISVFVDGDYVVRVDRIYVPGLSINGFSTFKLEFGGWRSWATNYRFFKMATVEP